MKKENQRENKTLIEEGEEAHKAYLNLRDEVFKMLKVEVLVNKLNKFLIKIWKF